MQAMLDDPLAAPAAPWDVPMTTLAELLFDITRSGARRVALCVLQRLQLTQGLGTRHITAKEMAKLRISTCQFALAVAAAFVKRACALRPTPQELAAALSLVRKGCNVLGHRFACDCCNAMRCLALAAVDDDCVCCRDGAPSVLSTQGAGMLWIISHISSSWILYSSSRSSEEVLASAAANKVTRPSTASSRARSRKAPRCSAFASWRVCQAALMLCRGRQKEDCDVSNAVLLGIRQAICGNVEFTGSAK